MSLVAQVQQMNSKNNFETIQHRNNETTIKQRKLLQFRKFTHKMINYTYF